MRSHTLRRIRQRRETSGEGLRPSCRRPPSGLLALVLLATALVPVVGAAAAQQKSMAMVDLGAVDVAQGLTRIQPQGGRTTVVEMGGLECRRNLEAGADDSIYFRLDDSFGKAAEEGDVYLTIHYFDTGSGTLRLEYDGAAGAREAPVSALELTRSGRAVEDVAVLGDSKGWRVKTFHLTDAYFGKRQKGGADFRIVKTGGGYLYIDLAYVRIFCNGRADCTRMVPSPFVGGMGSQIRSLFEKASQWTTARSRLDAIGTYDGPGGFDNATNQELQSWMALLDQWGLMLSMETGALAEWSCSGEHVFNVLHGNWDRVIQNGGHVDILAVDEPLRKAMLAGCWGSGVNANYWPTITQVVRWYQLVRQNYPDTQIYHIMPYRYHSRTTIQNWVRDLNNALAAAGVPIMDAFSLDADWRVFPGEGNWSEVKQIENYFKGLNIPFSMIYNPSRASYSGSSNNRDFWNDIMKQAADYKAAGGSPNEYDVQSWLQRIPTTVPESQAYTLSDSLDDLVAGYVPSHLRTNNATAVSNAMPTSMVAGQSLTVSVTMRNSGNTTWYRDGGLGYKLGADYDAELFAAGRHWLNVGETVAPGQSRTFTFTLTAPPTPGYYIVAWRMVEELVEWFGEYSFQVIQVSAAAAPGSVRAGADP